MQFILLAGGLSSRLWPITDKNTLAFCSRTLIERRVQTLFKEGFSRGVIVVNPNNLKLCQEVLADYENIDFVEQDEALGMADAILLCKEKLDEEMPLLISSVSDVVEDNCIKKLLDKAKDDPRADVVMLAKKCETYFPGGYLQLGIDDYLEKIVEKPDPNDLPSDLVNIVFHYFKEWPKFFEVLSAEDVGKTDDRYERALQRACDREMKLAVLSYEGFWQALKFPWHVLNMMTYFIEDTKAKIHRSAEISKKATIKGHVVIEEGVKVFENAVIRGPAYIGKGAVIANNALVRDSHIGAGSVVGYNTEIARSYLGENVWTHSNYIGDSVICDNCSFGAGTVTGNLRLDEGEINTLVKGEKIGTGFSKLGIMMGPDCRVGINSNLMPGVKVGKDCFVAAGVNVSEDLLDHTFLALKQEQIRRENTASIISDRNDFKEKI